MCAIRLEDIEGGQPRCDYETNKYHSKKDCNDCINYFVCKHCNICEVRDTCNVKHRIIYYKPEVQKILCTIKQLVKDK